MKKILLVISLIAVLFLTGCSKKNNVNNSGDVINNSGNQTQGSGNEVIENLKNDFEQEKYKLSDSYYISGETFDEKDCLIDFQNLETKKSNNSNYDIESDGMQFNITCELGENSEYIFKINGEKIELPNKDYFNGWNNAMVWVMDLDEKDSFKELFVKNRNAESEFTIYRLTKIGVKVLFDKLDNWNEFVKVDGRWIFTNYIYSIDKYKITIVYDVYEDGEFKFIDRFATGEKVDHNGNSLPEEFQKIEFSTEFFAAESEGISAYYKGDELNCAFNILSFEDKENTRYYNIKLTQDGEHVSYSGEEEHKETLPAGTVLENVELAFMS